MNNKFRGRKILVTAGPTREYLDPVRYISNESSGKMGYAIADLFSSLGAEVTLISGPVSISSTSPNVKIVLVKTANEMYEKCKVHFDRVDIAVFAAAVADYRPLLQSDQKIKKSDSVYSLELTKNIDIAFEFGKVKKASQLSIGFALETEKQIENATQKLRKKHFDAVVINSPNPGEGFGYETNKIAILNAAGELTKFDLKAKKEVALDIVNYTFDNLLLSTIRQEDNGAQIFKGNKFQITLLQ